MAPVYITNEQRQRRTIAALARASIALAALFGIVQLFQKPLAAAVAKLGTRPVFQSSLSDGNRTGVQHVNISALHCMRDALPSLQLAFGTCRLSGIHIHPHYIESVPAGTSAQRHAGGRPQRKKAAGCLPDVWTGAKADYRLTRSRRLFSIAAFRVGIGDELGHEGSNERQAADAWSSVLSAPDDAKIAQQIEKQYELTVAPSAGVRSPVLRTTAMSSWSPGPTGITTVTAAPLHIGM